MKRAVFVGLLVLAASQIGGCAFGGRSEYLGRPLPRLDLSHPIQGPAWQAADFRGSILVLEEEGQHCQRDGETLRHEVGELHDLLRTLARSCWDDPTMDCLRPRQDLSDGT